MSDEGDSGSSDRSSTRVASFFELFHLVKFDQINKKFLESERAPGENGEWGTGGGGGGIDSPETRGNGSIAIQSGRKVSGETAESST